ncbi:MAG: alpha/beta fold hydrolase [Trueperaceae bacterium]
MILWMLLILALLAAALLVWLGWRVSNGVLVPKPYGLMAEFEIVDVERDGEGDGAYRVVLPAKEQPSQFSDVRKQGVYNLLWEDGYGRLGPPMSDDGETVTRRLQGVVGEPPKSGDAARLDVTIFRRDPLLDHGIPFEELELVGEAGKLCAWWIESHPKRAVLALHGRRRADLTESLRILPTLVEQDWSVLALAYRNHDSSDPSPDGLFHYGASEADDALVAVGELARRGVDEVLLLGFSMGGAVALEAAARWPQGAPRLTGIVLDSPLLDPRTVIRRAVSETGLPLPRRLADLGLAIGSLRTGVDWDRLDQRRTAGSIEAPVLLIAGTADHTIPISLVDEFAGEVTAPIEYLRLEGVDHVEGWNRVGPRYEQAVARFLGRLSTAEGAPD